jgi:hypothetical protein
MLEDARTINKSELGLAQKMPVLKRFVFPRIDYRTMCVDLWGSHLGLLDAKIRGTVEAWFGIHGIPVEILPIS